MPTIGLEIHAELKTHTKMFCDSKNDPDETRPNVNVCPVCMAHPGTLPVINGEAVRSVLKVGIALKSQLADYTEFDRKNYFYPDLPKGYQLSQYEYPLVSGGELEGVAITRVHLEEDTASSIHSESTGETAIDYNRAGVPLMELVTDPVITSAEHAGRFARELQLLLRTLGVSDADMEKGQMRVEANVSVGKDGVLGTKVEIKNLNSFNAMERAVRYEIERQKKALERGESIVQETRGWDENKQATFSQRVKEGSADYRYFPDPDLPSLKISEIESYRRETLESDMPELPWERRARYQGFGVKAEDAAAFVRDPALANLFESSIEAFRSDEKSILLAANYIANDIVSLSRDIMNRETQDQHEIPISAQNFNKIIALVRHEKISSRAAKDMLVAYGNGELLNPEEYVRVHALSQEDVSGKIAEVVGRIIAENPKVVADIKSGKTAGVQFIFGLCMRELKGAADPQALKAIIEDSLRNS